MGTCTHKELMHVTFEAPSRGQHPYQFHVIRCKGCEELIATFPIDKTTSLLEIARTGFTDIIKAIGNLERAFQKR
jgi:hypothetical protein